MCKCKKRRYRRDIPSTVKSLLDVINFLKWKVRIMAANCCCQTPIFLCFSFPRIFLEHPLLLAIISLISVVTESKDLISKLLNFLICKLTSELHCLKSVYIRSFFWSVFSRIRSRKNSVFGYFSAVLAKKTLLANFIRSC